MLCMKSQHALTLVKFLHDQHGLAIGELKIYHFIPRDFSFQVGFASLRMITEHIIYIINPTVMFHFSSTSFSQARTAVAPAALFPATVIMLIM